MSSSHSWSKDTPERTRRLAALVHQLSLDEARLVLRLQVLGDIAAFVNLAYGEQAQHATRGTMLTTLAMFGWFARQGHAICRAIAQGQDAAPLLQGFVAGCSRFGGRGGEPLMGCEEIFAGAPELLLRYLQRGLVDLTTRWSELPPGDRYAFVRAVLDIDKIYSNTIGASEAMLFEGATTPIQRWRAGSALTMTDVLERWLALESNDSIYTGLAFNSGHRRTNREQLADYAGQAGSPHAYHLCWAAIVNAVATAKNIPPNNHAAIVGFFAQNVPAIVAAFRPQVPEQAIRDFVERYLPYLLAHPEPPPLQAASGGGELRLKAGELNKLAEFDIPQAVRFVRAANATDRGQLIDELLAGKTFTRRLNDEKVVFVRYDEQTREYVFAPA